MNKLNKPVKLEKRFQDDNGQIIVRSMTDIEGRLNEEDMPIAEMITQGCTIGFWTTRLMDKTQWIAEFREVHDRLTTIKIEGENLTRSLYWGRRIADTIIDFYFN
jgi:hypothetical protein